MRSLRYVSSGVMMVGLALATGCGQPEPETGETVSPESDGVDARVAQLERTVDALRTEIAILKNVPATTVPVSSVSTTDVTRLDTQLQALCANIEAMIDARIEERIGTQNDIQAIFEETVTEEMARAEERKKEENRRRAEESRKKWQEQRAKREEERFTKMSDALSLNVWQQEQTKSELSEYRAAKQAAVKAARAGSGHVDHTAYREALKKAEAEHRDIMARILSPEQMAVYTNSWQSQVGGGHTVFLDGSGINSTISITTTP